MGVRVIGTGSYVPDSVISNEHLHARLGFDSEWIVKRTGILERRHVLPHQATSDLCVEAGQRCMAAAGVHPKDVDLLVLATFTPDMSFPSTACMVQDRLELNCPALEIEAACAGFMYAFITAAAYVASGASDMALVIGGDTNSRILNPDDIKTYPLFGDGAGAVLLTRGNAKQGIISYSMGADGAGGAMLCRPAGGSRTAVTPENLATGQQYMQMDGQGVYRWAVEILRDTVEDVLTAAKMTTEDVHLFIAHQANVRIIEQALGKWLKIPQEKVFNNLEKYGNTSGGSIPIALDEAIAGGKLNRGELAIFSGFGAGLAWGTALVRW